MRMSRRGFLVAGASLPLVGMAGKVMAQAAGAGGRAGNLTIGLSTYPPNLQPWVNAGAATGSVTSLIHRGLLSYSAEGQLQGELAESWERDGDTGWVFHLRDAKFHNGAPVTAEDVKWNLDQIAGEKSTAYMRNQFQGVEKIETPDARTVRLIMKQPTVTVPDWFATYYMPIVAPGTVSRDSIAVGAGPFKLKSLERGVSIDLEAFDGFYKPGMPKLATVRIVAYPDENLRVAALQSGDVDLIDYVPWAAMGQIEQDKNLKLDTTLGPFMYLTFNGRSGPFSDARVRRAVALAVNRNDIVQSAFFGRGGALEGLPLPEGTPYYDEARSRGWRRDLDAAKALLAEAGMAGGFSCTLLSTAQYGMHKNTAEVVQQNLADLGIQVALNMPDWATRVAVGNRGQYEFSVNGTAMESADPDSLSALIDDAAAPSYIRSTGITVPGLSALLQRGRAEFDQEKRRAIYAQVEDLVLEQAPIVGLAWRSQGFAMKANLQGFTNIPGPLSFYSATTLENAFLA
ncbi:peptide ABC transporter substrate-binding protein [Skermanella stibiiresistens SB22]|uniref:Peptide ABC transporter substrate-binding protein n=1 Tax=Skermanella stibiiresistens SB22 TaxID=1385369 RepID=W9HAW6_9PROT|nr:ABC transporter substrate-binding protein [Skermanella stibiiresistens]EWY41003.1 peptide ABC transporter substrate-binding protein [Skermanella stibiiresistens SB22]